MNSFSLFSVLLTIHEAIALIWPLLALVRIKKAPGLVEKLEARQGVGGFFHSFGFEGNNSCIYNYPYLRKVSGMLLG